MLQIYAKLVSFVIYIALSSVQDVLIMLASIFVVAFHFELPYSIRFCTIWFTAKLTACGLILPSSWYVICVWNIDLCQLNSVVVVRGFCWICFLCYALFNPCYSFHFLVYDILSLWTTLTGGLYLLHCKGIQIIRWLICTSFTPTQFILVLSAICQSVPGYDCPFLTYHNLIRFIRDECSTMASAKPQSLDDLKGLPEVLQNQTWQERSIALMSIVYMWICQHHSKSPDWAKRGYGGIQSRSRSLS